MDIESKLRTLDKSIDEYNIDVYDSDILSIPIRLAYYEISEYSNIIVELNRLRTDCSSYVEKEQFIKKYKKVYLSQRKKYQRLLKNLNNGTARILYPDELKSHSDSIYGILEHSWEFDRDKSLDENLNGYMKAKLRQRIHEVNQELFKLKNHPTEYINTFSTFIGPHSVSKYRNDIITYKDVYIAASESHSYSVYYNEDTDEDTKNALLNTLAYFNGEPCFYFTENYDFNRKLYDLYEQFDLLDMLRLRKNNFFDSKQKEPYHLELPILKNRNGYNIINFQDSQHEIIFELYHASLKQFEPLPRCVFLYRVFEYGACNHYQPLIKPSSYTPEGSINYYVNEIMKHKYNPLYYVDFGTYEDIEKREIIRKRKAKYVNLTTKLKEEAKKIVIEWSNHPYLHNKSIGNIIYNTGRNAVAHGGGGRSTSRYDYSMNYKHINDVNIFLELIARYIIEKLNPHLGNMVEKRTKFYIKYNNYEKIFKQERDY